MSVIKNFLDLCKLRSVPPEQGVEPVCEKSIATLETFIADLAMGGWAYSEIEKITGVPVGVIRKIHTENRREK